MGSLRSNEGSGLLIAVLRATGQPIYPINPLAVWVPNRSSTSCDLGIFVDQPAKSVATSEVRVGR
jgi:hypothetical protein